MAIRKGVAAVAVGALALAARVVQVALWKQAQANAGPRTRTLWHWRCECGGKSRGGDPFKVDAEYNAERHRHYKGFPHPMPEVYPVEEEDPR
ncbi:hypothetical protein [Streptomyces sp. NPDC004528]|uniref:hypothetical protein n=1 Tax=Streptomyces sp. NPDC004528 TaxID=3154550 RepID=UPI0033A53847